VCPELILPLWGLGRRLEQNVGEAAVGFAAQAVTQLKNTVLTPDHFGADEKVRTACRVKGHQRADLSNHHGLAGHLKQWGSDV